MNKYNDEDLRLAERIMGNAREPDEAADWIAEYRDELETNMAENVAFVHQQLQVLRQRELGYLQQIDALHYRIAGLLADENFEKADTIPAPAPYAYYCPAQGE